MSQKWMFALGGLAAGIVLYHMNFGPTRSLASKVLGAAKA